jgi:hypothetical protein
MTSRRILVALAALAMAGGPVDKPNGVITYRNDVVHLNQGWSAQDRLRYYYTSQGSAALSYDILLNIETPNNQVGFEIMKF